MLKRRLLALLSALVMLATLIPVAALPVAAKLGGDFPWTEGQTLLEQILERDGFIDGIWYPWLNSGGSSHNFTGNELMAKYHGKEHASVSLDLYGADNVYREIYNLKAMGYNMLAWGGSIYGEGVIFDDYGDVLGIKQDYLDNARRFLNICREVGMPVMWNVYFHSDSACEYYHAGTWNILAQMVVNPTVGQHYADRFVAPLCDMLAEYPDVVAMVSIADEPENEINDPDKGDHLGGGRSHYGTTLEDMRNFMLKINEVVKEKLPNVPRTVASNDEDKALYRDFALDLMGHNRYNNTGDAPTTEHYVTYTDIILTEYNVGGEFPGDEVALAETLIKYRKNMMAEGYKGGFQWCWLPNATDAAYYLLYSKYDNTAFKETVALLRYFMNDYRAEYRGETVTIEPAVLYANTGDGKVEWIPSRQAVKVDVLRSDDGGTTWKAVAKDLDQASCVNKGKATYRDNDTAKPKSGFMYKVVSYDAAGNKVESEPNDPAGNDRKHKVEYTFDGVDYPTNISYQKPILTKDQADLISFGEVNSRVYLPESNLILNGSFENAEGGQWNNRSFLNTTLQAVKDPTAPDGDKVLRFDSTSLSEGAWYKFKVDGLEPNTDYIFSTWIKGEYLSENNACKGSIGVIDPDTDTFMIYWEFYRDYSRSSRHTEQIYPTCWDDEWHLRSVMFNSGDLTSYEIAVYGYGSVMYVDDVQLFKNGDGIKYTSGHNDNMQTSFLWEPTFCDPADSATKDVTVDGKDFWQSGDGWNQGFMSVAESRYGYGNSLKYTASEDPHGLYYLKWFDVEPNTTYHISYDLKIQKSGAGRIVLKDGKLTGPGDAFSVDLDAEVYGTDWFNFYAKFKTGVYDKIAFGVVDQGGEALIDNIRIFKAADEQSGKDLYTYTVKSTPKATYGKEVSVTARAEGTGLKYAWYYKDKGASKFSLTTSMTGKTYSVKMNEARDGRQVYCVITDKYGNSRKTETTTLSLKPTALKITKESSTVTYAKYKAKASVKVTAQGDGLKYAWYVKNSGASKYSKSSITSSTYSVTMTDKVKGRRVYCVITDAHGKKVQSKTFMLRMSASIATQPKSTTVAKNKTASVKVSAKGDGLKYTWYVKNSGASKYSKSSVTKSTYSVKMTTKVKNRLVYCVVTDKYGKKVKSSTVRLKMK